MNDITDRQREILSFVSAFQGEWGAPPTLREIAKHFRFNSTTAATAHLRALRRKGYLDHKPRQARGSRIVHKNGRHGMPPARVPVYSSLPRSSWSSSTEGFEGWLALDSATLGIANPDRVFALSVRGDALCRWHILDGDLLVMEQGRTPAAGEVVAVLDGGHPKVTVFAGDHRQPRAFPAADSISCPVSEAEWEVLAVMVVLIRMGSQEKNFASRQPASGGLSFDLVHS